MGACGFKSLPVSYNEPLSGMDDDLALPITRCELLVHDDLLRSRGKFQLFTSDDQDPTSEPTSRSTPFS